MSKNTKELPTMPYRPFAETLDRIIGSTDEFKTKLYNAFEERRLAKTEPEKVEEQVEEKPFFANLFSETQKPEEKVEEKSFFDNLISGTQKPEEKVEEKVEEKSFFANVFSGTQKPEEKVEEKSFFDNIFSGKSGLENISEEQPALTPANAPQHKCVIREW